MKKQLLVIGVLLSVMGQAMGKGFPPNSCHSCKHKPAQVENQIDGFNEIIKSYKKSNNPELKEVADGALNKAKKDLINKHRKDPSAKSVVTCYCCQAGTIKSAFKNGCESSVLGKPAGRGKKTSIKLDPTKNHYLDNDNGELKMGHSRDK